MSAGEDFRLDHLEVLESESLFVIREALAVAERPVILFSGGKDSLVVAHLARQAVWPVPLTVPLLHVDTGHNFPETLAFRDELAQRWSLDMRVASVEASIEGGRVSVPRGASRNAAQAVTLVDALADGGYDVALGGARRDEDKARAKERFFSHRNAAGEWTPAAQRPEPWLLFNASRAEDEHFRVFPLSSWTELDVWLYLRKYDLPLPSLYFAHERKVFGRDGVWLADEAPNAPGPDEPVESATVRFRTIGDVSCTGASHSTAADIDAVIQELEAGQTSERSGRADDRTSPSSMEDRKRTGYF